MKDNLNFKVFLGVFSTLFLTFLVCFVILGVLLPHTYRQRFSNHFSELVLELSQELAHASKVDLIQIMNAFSFENHAFVFLDIADEVITSSFSNELFDSDEGALLFSVMATQVATGELLVLNVEISEQPIFQVISTLQRILPYLFSLTLVIAFGFSWISARTITNPIIEISRVSKKMQQLDLKARCHFKRNDEIGVLAYNLNEMADKVERALEELKGANLLLNEHKQQQKDFFVAVSHELKTPLTVLRTRLEGMLKRVGEYHDRELHLKLAIETADGMSDLIEKLFSISKMQSGEAKLKKAPINFGALVEATCQKYKALSVQKVVPITHFCETDVVVVADKSLLEIALSNILSNAILHSPEYGLVDVQLAVKEKKAVLTVENYNAKIHDADLPHVFEPFYRIDKSRSRHTGGSGLGLYSTKIILDLHDVIYGLENSENGVRFNLEIPTTDKSTF